MQPIERLSLPQLAEKAILNHVRETGLGPGDPLPGEIQLAETLQLSRPSLREGLARLRHLGLITSIKRRGMMLQKPRPFKALQVFGQGGADPDTLDEWCELRLMLETGAIRIACLNMSDEVLAHLELLCQQESQAKGDLKRIAEIDRDFHHSLIQLSGNQQALDLCEGLSQFFETRRYKEAYDHWHDKKQPIQVNHRPILDALKSGQPEQCSQAMYEHLLVHVHKHKGATS